MRRIKDFMARATNSRYIPISPSDQIDRLFHAIAAQIPWKKLASSGLRQLLTQGGYRLPPPEAPVRTHGELALLNKREEAPLGQEIRGLLERSIFCDFKMCQEFRYAAIEMCLEALGQGKAADGVVEDWLHGELRLISALKPCLIFQKIVRHNARHMLSSLAHWIRFAGSQGLVLAIDIGRYLVDRRPKEPDGTLYYSRPATLEAYEVLRQLVDGTDDTEGRFVVVIAPPDFLGNERRGLATYGRFASGSRTKCAIGGSQVLYQPWYGFRPGRRCRSLGRKGVSNERRAIYLPQGDRGVACPACPTVTPFMP